MTEKSKGRDHRREQIGAFRDPGARPDLAWLPIGQLQVDPRYQRGISRDGHRAVNRIARRWSWDKCGVLIVARAHAEGEPALYNIIDGQHRWEAAQLREDIPELPCAIVAAATTADEASVFAAVNDDRLGLQRVHLFWAQHAAGDAQALRIKAICDGAGVAIARIPGNNLGPLTLNCVATLARLLSLGDATVTAGLKALADAQPNTPNLFTAYLVSAAVLVHGLHGARIDGKRMRAVLREVDPDTLKDEAGALRATLDLKLSHAAALLLVRRYNRGLGANRLAESFGNLGKAAA